LALLSDTSHGMESDRRSAGRVSAAVLSGAVLLPAELALLARQAGTSAPAAMNPLKQRSRSMS
jgi:hypothetical protein